MKTLLRRGSEKDMTVTNYFCPSFKYTLTADRANKNNIMKTF